MVVQPFRSSNWPTLGVELELQLVDQESLDLTPAANEILNDVPEDMEGSIKRELFLCCVEINTGICRDVDEIGRDLAAKLAVTADLAARVGARIAWGGAHPFAHWLDQPISPDLRYHELIDQFQDTLLREMTFGLHVHVGVKDGDTAARTCTRVAHYLPALLALSANSPFWCGRPTGLRSYRLDAMGTAPTGGQPPFLADWASFVKLVERLAEVGCIKTTKELWWDVRPSDRFGTVEVRICDMPTDLASVQGLAAFIQCLVHHLAEDADHRLAELDEFGRLMIRQNRWRSARHGLDAVLVDPTTGRNVPVRDEILRMTASLKQTAEKLGCARWLDYARVMAERPDGATRQLAVFEQTGRLTDVVRLLTGEKIDAEDDSECDVRT
jgi:glutamate---cysteine ligase / carboxylate-amine ligase